MMEMLKDHCNCVQKDAYCYNENWSSRWHLVNILMEKKKIKLDDDTKITKAAAYQKNKTKQKHFTTLNYKLKASSLVHQLGPVW